MGSSFRQWESDPLFSAAEVVQDSADRMDSIFRLLLHEQSLIREDHQDAKLLKSIEYYRRDLSTAVETAKWQLEDFEREVNLSAATDKSHVRENIISRHRQFVSAIREQIYDVGKSLLEITKRLTLDEQDRNGLASFLSGENVGKHAICQDAEDSNSMIRFLDPSISSNLNDEIVEHKSGEHLHMNGSASIDKNMESNLRKVGSHFSMNGNFEASSSLQDAMYSRLNEDGRWDLEANEATSRSFFNENGSRRYNSTTKIFGPLNTLWFNYGSRVSRSFTKRWKDGEERRKSQYHALRGNCRQLSLNSGYVHLQVVYSEFLARVMHLRRWIAQSLARYRRSTYYTQIKGHLKLVVPAIILTLIVLGILLL